MTRQQRTRSWTDEVFALFIEGRFGTLEAADVCCAIDWIAGQPPLLDRIGQAKGRQRESCLAQLVRVAARQIRRGGAPDPLLREGR